MHKKKKRLSKPRKTHKGTHIHIWVHVTHRKDGINDLVDKAVAVLNAATVLVCALVCPGLQELVEQVPVGGVQLNAIKARLLGNAGRVAEILLCV